MIHECRKPIPCATPLGDGYIWYIKDNGMLENDEFCVVLLKGGHVRHFTSDQIKIWENATYGIRKNTAIDELPF